jgi:c-di-GMP-related signal transduction protein
MLSLLHVAHGIDIQSFVDDLPLEASIKAAIAQRDGELGQLINSAERWERAGENAPLNG